MGAAACAANLGVIPHDPQGCSDLTHMLQINPRDFLFLTSAAGNVLLSKIHNSILKLHFSCQK